MSEAEKDAVVFQQAGDVTVAAIQTPEITSKASDMLEARLKEAGSSGQAVKFVLDLSSLDFLGSVGLSVLVVFLQRVRKSEGHLALAGLSGLCRDVMHVTGMERAFRMYDDVPKAVEALKRT